MFTKDFDLFVVFFHFSCPRGLVYLSAAASHLAKHSAAKPSTVKPPQTWPWVYAMTAMTWSEQGSPLNACGMRVSLQRDPQDVYDVLTLGMTSASFELSFAR